MIFIAVRSCVSHPFQLPPSPPHLCLTALFAVETRCLHGGSISGGLDTSTRIMFCDDTLAAAVDTNAPAYFSEAL